MSTRSISMKDGNGPVLSNTRRLEGKVAVITGGASGIGATTVRLFAENGAKVVIADIQDQIGQTMSSELGENVTYIHCDVSKEDDIINLIETTISKYGKLDIMYNNAGIMDSVFGSILESNKSDLERVFGVNLVGGFLGAKHAARVMIPNQRGCILFTASACASIAGISGHSYAAAKHAIVGLAKNLAVELGQYGIRVNCISPFAVRTNITADMAEAALKMKAKMSEKDMAEAASKMEAIMSEADMAKLSAASKMKAMMTEADMAKLSAASKMKAMMTEADMAKAASKIGAILSEADMAKAASKIEAVLSEASNLKGVTLEAEDVARAALYLASDEARYISGHNLLVDGGFSIVNPSLMKLSMA